MGEVTARRRVGLDRGTRVLAAARGDHRGLQVPGPVATSIRWRERFDVVLLTDELRVAGHGGLWRFPVPGMVLVSDGGAPSGGLRVDFLVGGPLVVSLDDGGVLLERLRRQVAAYERALASDAPVALWGARGRLVAVVPSGSNDALATAIGLLLDRSGRSDPARRSDAWARWDRSDTASAPSAGVDDPGMADRLEDLRSRRLDLLARHGTRT